MTRELLLFIFSRTDLLPQVVHNSHDARQLPVLFFGGTLPLALLLGARGLLRGRHPSHVSQVRVTCPVGFRSRLAAACSCGVSDVATRKAF